VILLSQQAKVSGAASVGVAGITASSPHRFKRLVESFGPMRCRLRELAFCKTLEIWTACSGSRPPPDESATRGVSRPGAPPTSPSTEK
jgi:hypothetical protein